MFRFFINQDDLRIRIISGLTLVILILLASFSVYRVMQSQIEEMAASGLEVALANKVKLIENQIEKPLLGLFGPEKINVLKLNIALDNLK